MGACRRFFLSAAFLALTGCATVANFQTWGIRKGPVPIGPEWTEIHCPEPIAAMAPFQRLYLLVPVGLDVPNFHDKVIVTDDGKRVALYAEIIDTEGRVYLLNQWGPRTEFRGRNHAGYYLPLTSKDLPLSLRFNTVRLRSSSPIVLQDILWSSGNLY